MWLLKNFFGKFLLRWVNVSKEIERAVGYKRYNEQLSDYPTIQLAMNGGFNNR